MDNTEEILVRLGYTPEKIRQAQKELLRKIVVSEVDSFLTNYCSGNQTLGSIRNNAIASMEFTSFTYHRNKRMQVLTSLAEEVKTGKKLSKISKLL